MRNFNLDMKFDAIFIAFNSFLHIIDENDALKTFKAIKDHLSEDGQVTLDILMPNPDFLFDRDELSPLMDFKDSTNGDLVEIYEKLEYDNSTQICDICWEYRYKNKKECSRVFPYQMRMYYPDTINRMLIESGFDVIDVFGDYELSSFKESSALQIYCAK